METDNVRVDTGDAFVNVSGKALQWPDRWLAFETNCCKTILKRDGTTHEPREAASPSERPLIRFAIHASQVTKILSK
jgi:hypothetical protein